MMIISYPQGTRKAKIKRVFYNRCSILTQMETFTVSTVFQKSVSYFNKNNRILKNIDALCWITQI